MNLPPPFRNKGKAIVYRKKVFLSSHVATLKGFTKDQMITIKNCMNCAYAIAIFDVEDRADKLLDKFGI